MSRHEHKPKDAEGEALKQEIKSYSYGRCLVALAAIGEHVESEHSCSMARILGLVTIRLASLGPEGDPDLIAFRTGLEQARARIRR